jgi:hypothetical protein
MIPLVKKWWFLRQVDKNIRLHTLKSSLEDIAKGGRVLLGREFLIVGTDEYPGIARKSLRRLSWILWWRRRENTKKLKKRIAEHNDIFDSCLRDHYLEYKETMGGPMVAKGPLYDDVQGFAGLIELLGNKRRFYLSIIWAIFGPIITVIIYANWAYILNWLKKFL